MEYRFEAVAIVGDRVEFKNPRSPTHKVETGTIVSSVAVLNTDGSSIVTYGVDFDRKTKTRRVPEGKIISRIILESDLIRVL